MRSSNYCDELLVTLMYMNDVFISDYTEYDSTAIIDGPSNYCDASIVTL